MRIAVVMFTMLVLLSAAAQAQHSSSFGKMVTGNFDGSGKPATCTAISGGQKQQTASGFKSSLSAQQIKIAAKEVLLLNEGDLDGDGRDELTVVITPDHGCTYGLETYSFKNGKWAVLIPYLLWPTFCDPFGEEEAQQQIFRRGKLIYQRSWNPNEEDQSKAWSDVPVKTK